MSIVQPICELYDTDCVFNRFKLIEFSTSFVGLSSVQELDLNVDLTKCAYLKTVCEGKLMNFEEAREISPSHRAFIITPVNNQILRITYKPTSECVSKAIRQKKHMGNRFVFDLRLIKTSGIFCCNNESHAEIGRYYISGQYEFCSISHHPNAVDFKEVGLSERVVKEIRIRNSSKVLVASITWIKTTGFTITPSAFTILPKSSKTITIVFRPPSTVIEKTLVFHIRNPKTKPDEMFPETRETTIEDENFLTYNITIQANIVIRTKPKVLAIESQHHIWEPNPFNTYLGKALTSHQEHKNIGLKLLSDAKKNIVAIKEKEKFSCRRQKCVSQTPSSIPSKEQTRKGRRSFCDIIPERISGDQLLNVMFVPTTIEFGRVSLYSFAQSDVLIQNGSKYDVTFRLLQDHFILYTEQKLSCMKIEMKPFSSIKITILVSADLSGTYSGTFPYTIDNTFERRHPYMLEVGNPALMIRESPLKFGMVTNDIFVSSVPVILCNNFNVDIDFYWQEFNPEIPFQVKPRSGTVAKHSSKMCDMSYVCKISKSKTHEVECFSKGLTIRTLVLELHVINRKLSVKFGQGHLVFKDIPLNLECVEQAKLENTSREMAIFQVVEPLLPGMVIQPMSGIIGPKMIITFDVMVKIPCAIEFSIDLIVKLNNKEIISMLISGNVVEPKLIPHPKNIRLPRVPSYMITFIPVTLQNASPARTLVEVLDTGDENMFGVYALTGNEKEITFKFYVEANQSKTVYIKVYDTFRREYDMYIPFKINGLIGPPNETSNTTEMRYYVSPFEELYESNPKVKIKSVNKDITYVRIGGVITVPWVELSTSEFKIHYDPNENNFIDFTMTNVSKYDFTPTVLVSKIAPHFSLYLLNAFEFLSTTTEHTIKFDFCKGTVAEFRVAFHPKTFGRFVATALLFLDKACSIPYSNLTFTGERRVPPLSSSCYKVMFPPSNLGIERTKTLTLTLEGEHEKDAFRCTLKEEPNLSVEFNKAEIVQENGTTNTNITVTIVVMCKTRYMRRITLQFSHECGSVCSVDVGFCYVFCPITLHAEKFVSYEEDPYPFYPLSEQKELYEYLENCNEFLQRWMFLQGFRKELNPLIPDTFHAIFLGMSSGSDGKGKGINVSFLNFFKRISGPLMKYVNTKAETPITADEVLRPIEEIHNTYKEIIHLLKSRGSQLYMLDAKYLLSYKQFVEYAECSYPQSYGDKIFTEQLANDQKLFERLNKQMWMDLILQCYKVFVLETCFFDCACVTKDPRDIVNILINWFNENIKLQHTTLRADKPCKTITNITTDLSDGIAIISVFLNHARFIESHFSLFCEPDESDLEGAIVNNACLIMDVMTTLRISFPMCVNDFLKPNFLHMLFFSIHLYVTLPMYIAKEDIHFLPPLLKSSNRLLAISPVTQEALSFNFIILQNSKNCFSVEKCFPPDGNGKKHYLNIRYTARFVTKERSVLLVHGFNKTRIFDTYIAFTLCGYIDALNPVRKCKVTSLIYRPAKVDILVASPFPGSAEYNVYITDVEPTIPVSIANTSKKAFCVQRLNFSDSKVTLFGGTKDSSGDSKIYLSLVCLSTQTNNHFIWFISDIGHFFIRVATQPRWDVPLDTLTAKVNSWPIEPCSCGEVCECYRTAVVVLPHRNDLMLRALRYSLAERASELMLNVFDDLIESTTGQIILNMLLFEGGTNTDEITHILRKENTYHIHSRNLIPRQNTVTLQQHTDAVFALPLTVYPNEKSEKFTITMTSEIGMDLRTYKIVFVQISDDSISPE